MTRRVPSEIPQINCTQLDFLISHYCSTVSMSLLCASYCLLNSYSEDSGEIMFFLLLPIGSLKSVFHRMKPVISPESWKHLRNKTIP